MRAEFLECDDCGVRLMAMDASQAQKVAVNPYNYIVYCVGCKRDREVTHE